MRPTESPGRGSASCSARHSGASSPTPPTSGGCSRVAPRPRARVCSRPRCRTPPPVTLTAGAASGLVALGHAADLVRAGHADAVVAGGADALDDDLRRWLAAGGLDCGRAPAEGAALVVLEHAERARGRAVLGTVEGVGAGFEPDPAGEGAGAGLAAAVATALEEAGLLPSEVRVVVSAAPPALAGLERPALGGLEPRTIVRPKDTLGETFGAAGTLGLLAALAAAPREGALLVLDVCASGHVAALVARAGD